MLIKKIIKINKKKKIDEAEVCDTYPNCTGPRVLCRAIESSLMRALVIDSVGFTPPSCCSTTQHISKPFTPPHLIFFIYHDCSFLYTRKENGVTTTNKEIVVWFA